jgi:4-hydroxyphenylpyruvate dioxygenase
MLKSIATVALKGALPDKLRAIAKAGYQGFELFENDLVVSDQSATDIRALSDDLGLSCVCYQPFRDFEGLAGVERERAFSRARRKFEVMQALGADLMLVCSSVAANADGDLDRIAGDFAELGDFAAAAGVRVGYEALAWGRYVNDHRTAWDIVRKADHPSIGLILDSFHSLARDIPIDSLSAIDGDRVFLVQIADAPGIPMDPLYLSRHFRCFPGQGDLLVADYVAAILRAGYSGPLSLEIFNDRFRAWSADQIAKDGWRSLVMLEDEVARQASMAARPPPPPPRVSPSGVTFIEFAASPDEAQELSGVFAGLGFAKVGQHRTKAVSRWRQGDVNLVLNQDPDGFAHAHAVTHGASVCAFGIGVEDSQDALHRADALGMSPYRQAHAPGELEMPCIRGVGGSLIYFTPASPSPAFWATDFEPVIQDAPADAGLTSIDHLAQSMPPEEFLSWQLYYTSLLTVTRTPTIDILDPSGLVQSQAIASPDGRLRITLNGAEGQTLASRFVHNYFGAGIQHIAFATEDIFATVAALRAQQVELLTIPENYYDDLQSRFDLDDASLQRLKAAHILYDRDASGDYFQVYARAFKKRFFFEFVQRADYRGYGAPNASTRLAAQARAGAQDPAMFL